MSSMIAVLQRVASASVTVGGTPVGETGRGLLILLCAVRGDGDADLEYLVRKVSQIRIFEDESGRMNRSVRDVTGGVLVVPQFTLAASTRTGSRPSFDGAESPERAQALYDEFTARLRGCGIPVSTGRFGAMMAVSLVNDGPVTIILDSRDGRSGPAA